MQVGRDEARIGQLVDPDAPARPGPDGFVVLVAGRNGGLLRRFTDKLEGVYSVPVLGGDEHLLLANTGFPEALADGSVLILRTNSER